jgi:hypothetical protein
VELTLPAGAPERWHVVAEKRETTASGGKLRDRFAPYAAHVYATDAVLASKLSLAETEAAIAKANAERRKPGNLAFEDNGTSVRVSSKARYSSSPDRVIDGVLDGMAWRDDTPNKYPDWVEIDFPKAVTIGRVVVYSTNLVSGAVQAKLGEEWKDLAPLSRDSDRSMTTTFEPTSTSALRVTVTKAATPFVSITEVEAYEK